MQRQAIKVLKRCVQYSCTFFQRYDVNVMSYLHEYFNTSAQPPLPIPTLFLVASSANAPLSALLMLNPSPYPNLIAASSALLSFRLSHS